jgi:hypothetical protein
VVPGAAASVGGWPVDARGFVVLPTSAGSGWQ